MSLSPTAPVSTYVPRPSRMDLLGRRDASRWGGLSDVEVEAREAAKARRAAAHATTAGPPLEGGNESVGGVLHAQMAQLEQALRAHAALDHVRAAKLLDGTLTFLRGAAGLPTPKPIVPREGDPPLPPPPPPTLAIDHAIMHTSLGSAKDIAPELLLQAAEVAAKLSNWPMVWSCLSLFASTSPPLSQYLLRGLLVQARAQAHQARGKKGAMFTADVVDGASLVLRAVKLIIDNATSTLPQYTFLLYNAAATFLDVVRPLLRQGFRSLVLDGFVAMTSAIDQVPADSPERDAALEVELLRQAALCADETGDSDVASRFLAKGWSVLCKRYTRAPLPVRVAYVKTFVHVHRSNPKAVDLLLNDLDLLSRTSKTSVLPAFRQLVALQRVRSGAIEGERADAELRDIIDQLSDPNIESIYEETDDAASTGNNAAGARKKAGTDGRKSPAPSLSSGPGSASKKKRLKESGGASSDTSSTNPHDLALQEAARLAEVEAARVRERAKKKSRAESHAHRMEVMAEAGWEAFQRFQYPLAQRACNAAIVVKRTGLYASWILAECLGVVLDIRREEARGFNEDGNRLKDDANSGLHGYASFTHSSSSSDGQGFGARIRGLKVLDQTLASAARLSKSHPDLVERLVLEAWNLLMPLLQRDLVARVPIVPKLLKTCAQLLGDESAGGLNSVETPLLEMRVLMHYEIALWEASNDYVAKATTEMERAVALDYTYADNKLGPLADQVRVSLADTSADRVEVVTLTPNDKAALALESHRTKELPFVHALRPHDLTRLQPFLHKLRVQAIMYDEPLWFLDSREDQAVRWLEQAREVKVTTLGPAALISQANPQAARLTMGRAQNHMKKNLVMKAIQLLDTPIYDALNSSAGVVVHAPGCALTHTSVAEIATWSLEVRMKRAACWRSVLQLAWDQGFEQLVHVAAAHLLELTHPAAGTFDQDRHAPLLLAQVDALTVQARACVHQIEARGFEPGLIRPPTVVNNVSAAAARAEDEDATNEPSATSTTTSNAAASAKGATAGTGAKKRSKEKVDEKAAAAAAAAAAEEAKLAEAVVEVAEEAKPADLDPETARIRDEALFYEQLLHSSITGLLQLSSQSLVADRYAYIAWNTGVLFHNAFKHLWYHLLGDAADSNTTWLYAHSPSELAAGRVDTRTVLVKVWEQLVALARSSSGSLRKPGLLVQLATVLARTAERTAPTEALSVITSVIALVQPQATASVTHPSHPVHDPLKKRQLYECWTRLLLRKSAPHHAPSSSASGAIGVVEKKSVGGLSAESVKEFTSVLGAQASSPELQLFMLLELLRSHFASNEEKKTRLMEAVNIMAELAGTIHAKLQVSLEAFNGDVDDLATSPVAPTKGRGAAAGSTKKRSGETGTGARASSSDRKKKRAGGAGGGGEDQLSADPLDPARRINAATYERHLVQLRELESRLWTDLSLAAHALGGQQILAIQTCYFGLQGCPEYAGPKLDLPQGIVVPGANAPARPFSSRAAPSESSRTSRKSGTSRTSRKSTGGDEIKEDGGSAASTARKSSPSSSPRTERPSSESLIVEPPPKPRVVESLSEVSSDRLRNYAHMCLIYGLSVVEMIDPLKHDQPSQDQIRRAAIDFFQQSTMYASRAIATHLRARATVDAAPHLSLRVRDPKFEVEVAACIMLQASKYFWNTALPMTYESLTRRLLIQPIARILENLEKVVEVLGGKGAKAAVAGGRTAKGDAGSAVHALDPAFRCDLYTLYFDALKDAGEWQTGYASTSSALKSLPAHLRRVIWTSRILFMSKLGLDVGVGILKMKDASRANQSRIWLHLARQIDTNSSVGGDSANAANRAQKYDFFVKALDVLDEHASASTGSSHADTSIETVEVLLEFSEFLYASNFSATDCVEQLLLAVDLLAAREPDVLQTEEAIRGAWPSNESIARLDPTAVDTRMARSMRQSPASSPRGAAPPAASSRRTPSMSGARLSMATGGVSPRASAYDNSSAIGGDRTAVSTFGTTVHTPRGGGDRRGSSRGSIGRFSIPSEEPPRGLTIKHLILLIRVYAMLGVMSSTTSEKVRMALVAHHYTVRVWSEIMSAVDQGFFGRAPPATAADRATTPSAAASAAMSLAPSQRGSGVFSISVGAASIAGAHGRSSISKPGAILPTTIAAAPAAATTPYVALPTSAAEWLGFQLPQSVRSWLNEQASSAVWSEHVLHRTHLEPSDAVILLHYLEEETLPTLLDAGFHLHALPLLHLMELVVSPSGSVLRHRAYQSLVHLKLASVMDDLHQPSLQALHLTLAEPILPNKEEATILKNLVEKREQLQRVQRAQAEAAEREAAAENGAAAGTMVVGGGRTAPTSAKLRTLPLAGLGGGGAAVESGDATATFESRPQTAMTAVTTVTAFSSAMYGEDVLQTSDTILASVAHYTPAPPHTVGPDVNIRRVWCDIVGHLLARGRFGVAKQLLTDHLLRFCRAWAEDTATASAVHRHLSRLAQLEGAWSQSVALERHAQSSYFGSPADWLTGLTQLTRVLTAQAHRAHTPTALKQTLESKALSTLIHATNTFTRLLHRDEFRSSAGALKRGIARALVASARMLERQERRAFAGFGDETFTAPSTLPISFAAASEVSSTTAAAGGSLTGGSRVGTSFSAPGSAAASQSSLLSGRAALAAFNERSALNADQQSLYEEIWRAYEKAAIIYDVGEENSGGAAGAAASKPPQVDEALRPLDDASALADVLLSHALSLLRYAGLFAYPSAEALSKSTAASVSLNAMLAKVTRGTAALHRALLLLQRAEGLLSSTLMLAQPAHLDATISMPMQRRLHRVNTALAHVYLQLYRFKRPRRRYVDADAEAAATKKPDVLRLQSGGGGSEEEDRASLLSFAEEVSSRDGSADDAAREALWSQQESMNALFFDKYAAVFRDAAAEAQAILDAPKEVAYNERAVQRAATAVNLEGSFATILVGLAATQNTNEAATAAASTTHTVLTTYHPRLLLDSPDAWLKLGQALTALHRESEDQRESDRFAAAQSAAQAKQQADWTAQVAASTEAAHRAGTDPRTLAREAAEAQRARDEEDRVREAETAREEAARQELFEAEAARAKLEAEVKARAEAADKGKKKRGSTELHGSDDKPSSPTRKPSAREAKLAAAAEAAAAAAAAADESTTRPDFGSFAHDTSSWSPAHLQQHLDAAAYRVRAERDAAAAEEDGKKKPSAAAKKATPTGASPKGKGARKLETEPSRPTTGVDPLAPVLPTLPSSTSLEGQAMAALQRTVDLCVRRDFDLGALTTLSRASLELVDLVGTKHPALAARYLTLHASAKLKALALDAWEYASPSTGSESLVLERARLIQDGSQIPGPELEMTRKFFKAYSDVWRTLSSFSAGFFDADPAAAGTGGSTGAGETEEKEEARDASARGVSGSTNSGSDSSYSHHGAASFAAQVSLLPPSVLTVTLEYDAASQSLYGLVLGRDDVVNGGVPLVARASLSPASSKEFALLVSQYSSILQRLQRGMLVYGCLSSSAQLDALERAYDAFLARLDAFFTHELFQSLLAWSGVFRGKDVVLLVTSPTLWHLPLESLSIFAHATSVARDFSLALLASRIAAHAQAPMTQVNAQSVGFVVDAAGEDGSTIANPAVVGSQAAGLVATAKSAPPPAANAVTVARPPSGPSARKPAKGGAKVVLTAGGVEAFDPLDPSVRDPLTQPDFVRVLSEMRGVAVSGAPAASLASAAAKDGAKDAASKDKDKSAAASLAALRAQSAGWVGVSGDHHAPVVGEWAHLLTRASSFGGAFLYAGYESFLARFSPAAFVQLPHLNGGVSGHIGTQALLLFDRGVNDKSYRAQSRADNSKTGLDRSLEGTFFTALFASLKGVSSVLMRAHASAGPSNAATAKLVLEALLFDGATLASAARSLHRARLAFGTDAGITTPSGARPMTASDPADPNAQALPIDMVRYLDHAVWAADMPPTRSGSPKKGGAARSTSQTRPGGSRPVRPMGPTRLRQRDMATRSPTRAGARSPTRAPSGRATPVRTAVKGRPGSRSVTPASRANASPTPAPFAEPAIKLRTYDKYNIICVGLPYLKMY